MGICSVDNCLKEGRLTRGYCAAHYQRWRAYSDPTVRVRAPKREGTDPILRFWDLVAITANPKKCWEWQGKITPAGYGKVTIKQHEYYAHRYSWFLAHGEHPTQYILHTCDNPRCVNPNHLHQGTHADNMQDKCNKGRHVHGERCPIAKLTDELVLYVRSAVQRSSRELGTELGVHPATIRQIRQGRSWKHLLTRVTPSPINK